MVRFIEFKVDFLPQTFTDLKSFHNCFKFVAPAAHAVIIRR